MLAYVAPLWFASVACLVVAVVGLPVKLAGSELPGIERRATRIAVAGIGVLAFVLGLVLFLREPSTATEPGGSANGPAAPPTNDPTTGERPAPRDPDTTSPRPTTSERRSEPAPEPSEPEPVMTTVVRVRWQGTLTMNALGPEGFVLDQIPPSAGIPGLEDLAIGQSGHEVVGRQAVVAWESARTPTYERCSNLVATNLGLHSADVRTGSRACFTTRQGRVGYFTVADVRPKAGLEPARLTLGVTIWDRATVPVS